MSRSAKQRLQRRSCKTQSSACRLEAKKEASANEMFGFFLARNKKKRTSASPPLLPVMGLNEEEQREQGPLALADFMLGMETIKPVLLM